MAILFNIVCINYLLMVRLEKIVYEQALNTNMLGRSRSISTPMKWWTTNPMEQNKSMLTHKNRVRLVILDTKLSWQNAGPTLSMVRSQRKVIPQRFYPPEGSRNLNPNTDL